MLNNGREQCDDTMMMTLNVNVFDQNCRHFPFVADLYGQGVLLTVAQSPSPIVNFGGLLAGISMVVHRASGNKMDNIMFVRKVTCIKYPLGMCTCNNVCLCTLI